MIKPEERIVKMLEVCTTNVSESTAEKLYDEGIDSVSSYIKSEYGWFVYVPKVLSEDNFTNIPDELFQIMLYARKKECSWIMFDRDVEPLEGFKVFEWDGKEN